MPASVEGEPRRRSPTQSRGERRVEQILASAAAILAEVGYDALTLTEVANRSGSAIGSLYHFFSSKDQLVDALVERLAARLRVMPALVLKPALAKGTIASFVHELFSPIAALADEHPEAPVLMDRVAGRNPLLEEEISDRLDAIIRARASGLPPGERRLIVSVTIELVRAGVRLVARAPKNSRRAVALEAETALASYLRSRIGDLG